MKPLSELLEFGIIIIDKPAGPTSFNVSDYVREQLGLRKTSHMGTLDPGVTGVLPITTNRACKLSPYFIKKEKEYVGIMRLHEDVSDDDLEKAIMLFTGTIAQKPPVRSNVKRVIRPRTVHSFEIIERDGKEIVFRTRVEAGTYIRTLIHDIGKKIGGAHMLELRRTRAGQFDETQAHTLHAFDEAVKAWKKGKEETLREMIIPADKSLEAILPRVDVSHRRLTQLKTGKPIHLQDLTTEISALPDKGEHIAVFCDEKFLEVARIVLEGEVIAVPEFVFN